MDVDALWCLADEASGAVAKAVLIGNLKQVFTNEGRVIDWFDAEASRRQVVSGTCDADKDI